MTVDTNMVTVLELNAWGLDPNSYRPAQLEQAAIMLQPCAVTMPPVENEVLTLQAQSCLESVAKRTDLHDEFRGLEWHLGVVNLRALIAFQRRLILPERMQSLSLNQQDWPHLTALSFGPPRSTTHNRISSEVIVSNNPDLVLRPSEDGLTLYGGSPFFEVALYAGRAFLRDGYHRAYDLLGAGITFVPAVIVTARSLEEVGATGTGFFSESTLLSDRPPLVADLLSRTLTHRYTRPRLLKTIRVHIEESFAPEV
jgi:hypothetical protein